MAWRRGTQNQQAKEIRMGHVKEFLAPSSRASALEEEKVSLKVIDRLLAAEDGCGVIQLPSKLLSKKTGIASELLTKGSVFLHAHEHPAVVLRCTLQEGEEACVFLTEVQRLNSRVCTFAFVEWTLYRGPHTALDAREAALGATEVTKHVELDGPLACVVFEVRSRFDDAAEEIDAQKLTDALLRHTFGCIVTNPEIFVVQCGLVEVVARVVELTAEDEDEETTEDCQRGMVGPSTRCYVLSDQASKRPLKLSASSLPPPPRAERLDTVTVFCQEGEDFPVRRALLRPCIALTSAVQAGRGKYGGAPELRVDLDCCTFDRVLLYLEHARRVELGKTLEPFKFDPTLAPTLLEAALKLQLKGLQDAANKVLGSFADRVRKTPIRLEEVFRVNKKGAVPVNGGTNEKRSATWIVLDGMVLDISRWLDEHPGGASVIPEQALNVDCTVFFEIYHVSRQSFLYLREFYIGELAETDRESLPLPTTQTDSVKTTTTATTASDAFLRVLRKHTAWRLKPSDLIEPKFKSF